VGQGFGGFSRPVCGLLKKNPAACVPGWGFFKKKKLGGAPPPPPPPPAGRVFLTLMDIFSWSLVSLAIVHLHFQTNKHFEFQAFSLDFNLRSHLKTHALENYHICPFPACGKRFTSDFKLGAHVKSHEKVCCYCS
jgi:hypothetical protein